MSLSSLTASQSHLLHHRHPTPATLSAWSRGGRAQISTSTAHLLAISQAQGTTMDLGCQAGQQCSQWLAVAKQQQQQQ
jgi:hypothetical protein